MKPMVLGLGNPLMGDDGAGARVAEMLARDSTVTASAEVWTAGTDVLRWLERMDGRDRVILVDAVESDGEPGRVSVCGQPPLGRPAESAHSLSAAQAVEVMRRTMPGLRETQFTWVMVHVASVEANDALSPEVAAAVPVAAAVVKGLLSGAFLAAGNHRPYRGA
jgi:hydrogenase maturation protease